MQSLIYHFFFLFTISLLICDTVLSQGFRRTNSLLICAASPLYCPILQILEVPNSDLCFLSPSGLLLPAQTPGLHTMVGKIPQAESCNHVGLT